MKKYFICLLSLIFLFSSMKTYSQDFNLKPLFTWTTASVFCLYDTKNKKIAPSIDIDSSYFFFNGGIGYKNLDNIDFSNLQFYAGLGFGSFIQFQVGFSGDGFSLRNRYDIPIGLFFHRLPDFLQTITISPSMEKYFGNERKDWYFGLGIGYSINNIEGFPF